MADEVRSEGVQSARRQPVHELLETAHQLRSWVEAVLEESGLGALNVELRCFGASAAAGGKSGVQLKLAQVLAAPFDDAAVLQFRARYVLGTTALDAEDTHRVFGALVFAALDSDKWEIDLDAGDGTTRPLSFSITTLVRREPRPRTVQRVLHSISGAAAGSTLLTGAAPLIGRLLGPGRLPIVGAIVHLPVLSLTTSSDARGYFRFPLVPLDSRSIGIEVRAKGETWRLEAQRKADADPTEPIECFCDFKEE